MKKLLLLAFLFSLYPAYGLEFSKDWKDCNLPENKAQCDKEYQEYRAKYAELQSQYKGQELLRKVCEEFHVCGSGGNAGTGGAAGGGR